MHEPHAQGQSRPERRPDIFLISGDAFEVSRFKRYGNPVERGSFSGALTLLKEKVMDDPEQL